MEIVTIFLIALSLAMDAFAVSIANGATMKQCNVKDAFKIAFFFGAFQAFMPVIGWFAGNSFATYVHSFAHWIAFGLLAVIGFKMMYEAAIIKRLDKSCSINNILVLTGLAVATSIDALVVGISFSFLSVAIVTPVIVIGLVTFALSFIGVYVGEKLGSIFSNKMEFAAGLVLLLIGIKIVLTHS
jgi:putative Mn2+ efflux pump MntP